MPHINLACFASAGDYRNLYTAAHMGGGAALTTLALGDLKYSDVGVHGRNLLEGIDLVHNPRASVVIDLNLEKLCEYLHVNIYQDDRTIVGKKQDKSAGSKAKGCIVGRLLYRLFQGCIVT
jgi:hypothetical protein